MLMEGLYVRSQPCGKRQKQRWVPTKAVLFPKAARELWVLCPLLRWRIKTQKEGAACPRSPRELMPEVGLDSGLLILNRV